MSSTKLTCSLVAGAAAFAFMSAVPLTAATAAEYPTKPITLVAPYGAGGASDMASRTMAAVLPKYLGQPVMGNFFLQQRLRYYTFYLAAAVKYCIGDLPHHAPVGTAIDQTDVVFHQHPGQLPGRIRIIVIRPGVGAAIDAQSLHQDYL